MSYDNLKLEKELYTTGKSFTKALESIDPDENYKGTPLEGLDAYQRQLKRFDIKVSGSDSDTVSKFFKTSDSAALFPEYVARAVKQGMAETNIVEQIIASTTNIDSLDYRAIKSSVDDSPYTAEHINEGSYIPEINVTLSDTLTPLIKRGRMLVASYEAVKYQKLDIFTVILKQIGAYISNCQLFDAVSTLVTNNVNHDSTTADLTYSELVDFWNNFETYNLTTIIGDPYIVAEMLNLTEFKDSHAGQDFHGTGHMITPFGSNVIKVPILKSSSLLVGIDKNFALEKVQASEIVTDFDKLIDRQLERATVSSIAGFSTIFPDAVRSLSVTGS